MVNFNNNNDLKQAEVLILGLPDHINQLGTINYNNEDLTQCIDTYRHQHLIGSTLGKVSSTLITLENGSKRLITVGLGNLKSLNYAELLKAFGHLFQYLKEEGVTDADVLFETFISKEVTQEKVCLLYTSPSPRD